MSRLLIANLGAEEGASGRERARTPAAAAVASLWRALFEAGPEAPGWLPGPGCAVAWLNTEEAEREARAAGLTLAGAAPAVVRTVHDKAFALRAAEAEGLTPGCLAGLGRVLDPDALEDAEAAAERILEAARGWPAWTGGRFTLKPRMGTSGRGRFGGRADAPDRTALAGALARLRRRGGAVLEPWLERLEDLSAQLVVGDGGELLLLGTLALRPVASGAYRGHFGTLDRKGRVTSGSAFDEALREAAAAVALRAAAAGHRGPCGVDAMVFRGPGGEPQLRPVVELNARYTVGIVLIGHVRLRRREITRPLRLDAGERARFAFAPEPPASGWPAARPPVSLLFPLAAEGGPALFAARGAGPADPLGEDAS